MSENESTQGDSTYFIDAENAAEMARLMTMANQVTEDMGGLFPPNVDPSTIQSVLDIGCGPGYWVLEVARKYAHIKATGGDVSHLMIAYARTLARDVPNAHFQQLDARRALPFPNQIFNVIQARFITAFMLASAWPELLRECRRMLQPGGTLCLIEGENFGISNSASLEKYNELLARAMRRAGHCFAPDGNMFGITPRLPGLLQEQGFKNVSQRAYALNFSAGTKANGEWYANYKTAMKLLQPFLLQWDVTTQDEVEVLYQRALQDIASDEFCGQWFYLAVAGENPS
jgi:ubiquinone/menaquinone biosynthesis C-methylase UbiE